MHRKRRVTLSIYLLLWDSMKHWLPKKKEKKMKNNNNNKSRSTIEAKNTLRRTNSTAFTHRWIKMSFHCCISDIKHILSTLPALSTQSPSHYFSINHFLSINERTSNSDKKGRQEGEEAKRENQFSFQVLSHILRLPYSHIYLPCHHPQLKMYNDTHLMKTFFLFFFFLFNRWR